MCRFNCLILSFWLRILIMAKTKANSKRKTRSDKFPLTLHPTGQYCKKIKGKIYYFGNNKKIALQRYLEQAAYLHMGRGAKPNLNDNFSLKTLCNLYLDHQESRSAIGEIKLRHPNDQTSILKALKKVPIPKIEKPTFSAPQIQKLLENASTQMRAMIWLGLNCG